jgi:exodeoxyribonuclease VIII
VELNKVAFGVPEHVYRSWPAPSYSLLKHVARSPAHALSYMLHPPEQTPAMLLGSITHLSVLEPDRFMLEVVARPEGLDRRTREGKALWAQLEAEHPGCAIIPADDYTRISAIGAAVAAHPVASALLSAEGRKLEASFAWEEEVDGVLTKIKGRADVISRVGGLTHVVDLKTTRDASIRGFAREVVNYRYMEQAALYLRGLNICAPAQRTWRWIAVESEPPYAVTVFEPFQSDLGIAEERILGWLFEWERCCRSEHWPAYSNQTEPLIVPAWAYSQ